MMRILCIACSSRERASESKQVAQKIIECLLEREPTAILINRMVGDGGPSRIDGVYATALGAIQPTAAEAAPQGSMANSEELIQELESADVVVIGTPMRNFSPFHPD